MIVTPNIQNWSYSHNPSDSDKDAVRYLIGDTNSNDKLVDDNEILYLLEVEGSVRQAAIAALQNLIVLYSRYVDMSGDKKSSAHGQRITSFEMALKTLLEKQAMSGLSVFAGGLTKTGKEAQVLDPDRVAPVFNKNMFANPRAVFPDNRPYDEDV
jgi:hypothetical protein